MTVLVAGFADAAIVLALGLAAFALAGRRSAALRHAWLVIAIGTAFVMPVLELCVPQLPVIRWRGSAAVLSSGLALTSSAATSSIAGGTTTAAGIPWFTVLVAVWIAGAAITGAGLVTGFVRLARLRRRSTPVAGRWRELTDEIARENGLGRRVTLLESDAPSLLVACGVLEPTIVLPAGAAAWSDDRKRIVLRHELSHLGRHDAVTQTGAEVLRVLHWMNPLAWIACRRLREESEYACDDAVIGSGVDAAEYATHLVEIAKRLSGRHHRWAPAPAIAHPSSLERRIVAMLQRDRNREPCGRRGWSLAALAALAIGIPLAAAGVAPGEAGVASSPVAATVVEPPQAGTGRSAPPMLVHAVTTRPAAAARQGTIAGRVLDQSGATIPGAEVTLSDPQTGARAVARTDAAGRFAFRDLQPARYDLVARSAGFATFTGALTVASGASVTQEITLPLGALQEQITVTCSASPAATLQRLVARLGSAIVPVLSAEQAPPAPVRVGGNVRPPTKTRDMRPICPASVPATETTVRLTARIGLDGTITDLTLAPADSAATPPADLTTSALDAVRQWTFTPTLLNGQAAEVDMTVIIVFKRSAG